MHLEAIAQPAPCAICEHVIHPKDQNWCVCGECICESCPSFACACIYDDAPTLNLMRALLRRTAIEKARLEALCAFMGADALSTLQQSHLRLLTATVVTLRDQVNQMDEIECGEAYPEDFAC